jgi:hypothetical protein
MTITLADWESSTDPYRAPVVAFDNANVTYGTLPLEEVTFDVRGMLNFITDDADRQQVVLATTATPVKELPIKGLRYTDTGGYLRELNIEFSQWLVSTSGGMRSQNAYKMAEQTSGTYREAKAAYKDTETGSDAMALTIRTMLHWPDLDPAQLVAALGIWYPASTFGGMGLQDFMDYSSFTSASQDFTDYANGPSTVTDDYATGLTMTAIAERGKTVRHMMEKAIGQTVDWLAVRPTDSTGVAALHYIRRQIATERTTVIDLDDGSQVFGYTGGVDDNLRVDALSFTYGMWGLDLSTPDGLTADADLAAPKWSFPLNLPTNEDTYSVFRRSGGDELAKKCDWLLHRFELDEHWQIYFWAWEQQDLTLKMGPLHYNYDVGDLVHIQSTKLVLDGSEWFVVYEKDADYTTHTATVRVMRVYGYEGTRPNRLAVTPFNVCWQRVETLTEQPRTTGIGLPTANWSPRSIRHEYWLDTSGEANNLGKHATPGNGPAFMWYTDEAESLNDWPIAGLHSGAPTGFLSDFTTAIARGYSIAMVAQHPGSYAGAEFLIWTGGPGDYFHWKLYDGFNGTRVSFTGTEYGGTNQLLDDTDWHDIACVTGDASNGGVMYEDGVDVVAWNAPGDHTWDTGTYVLGNDTATPAAVKVTEIIIGYNEWSAADVAAVSNYLREKYRHR